MSVLEIIAVLISVLGVTLTIKRHIACWVILLPVCCMHLFFEYQLYGELVFTNTIYGHGCLWFFSVENSTATKTTYRNSKLATL